MLGNGGGLELLISPRYRPPTLLLGGSTSLFLAVPVNLAVWGDNWQFGVINCSLVIFCDDRVKGV